MLGNHFRGFPDFTFSGQKDKNVAAACRLQFINGIGNRVHKRAVVFLVEVFHRSPADFHRIHAA